jgi:hypothetical protein
VASLHFCSMHIYKYIAHCVKFTGQYFLSKGIWFSLQKCCNKKLWAKRNSGHLNTLNLSSFSKWKQWCQNVRINFNISCIVITGSSLKNPEIYINGSKVDVLPWMLQAELCGHYLHWLFSLSSPIFTFLKEGCLPMFWNFACSSNSQK